MLEGRADIAVHSMKDLPVEFPPGLELHTICEREDPRDAFVSNNYKNLNELPEGAVVGTCSLRRRCRVKEQFPHLVIKIYAATFKHVYANWMKVNLMPLSRRHRVSFDWSWATALPPLFRWSSHYRLMDKAHWVLSAAAMTTK